MKKIIIHGFYGMGNLGDEAILSALLKIIGEEKGGKVTVVSRNPANVKKNHGVDAIREFGGINTIRRNLAIRRSDLFLLGGGGIIKDYGNNANSLLNWLKPIQMAIQLKRQTGLVCIGVENIRYAQSKAVIGQTFNQVDTITVRDQQSKDILEDLGVRKPITVLSDPAILLCKSNRNRKKNESPPKILVCVRHWFDVGNYVVNTEADRNLVVSLSSALDHLIEKYNAEIHFWPLRTDRIDDDRVMASKVITRMKHTHNIREFRSAPGVIEFIDTLKDYSAVIAMRLHAVILGTAMGIPAIGLNYMPKVKNYLESINQGQFSMALESLSADQLTGAMDSIFESTEQITAKLIEEIADLQHATTQGLHRLVDGKVC